jgi:chemotaxis protein CheD
MVNDLVGEMIMVSDLENNSGAQKEIPEFDGQDYVKLGQIISTNRPEQYNLLGIGTCLAVYIADLKKERYMMAHCLLPEFSEREKYNPNMPAKYTDMAIDYMVNKMLQEGSQKAELKIKIVGGGQIYNDALNIGARNIECAKAKFAELGLKILAEDIGGKSGRSILSYNRDGSIFIRKQGVKFTI